jgi:hypothetical protein
MFRSFAFVLTQLSRNGRRKIAQDRRGVQRAIPIACRIAQRQNCLASELPA